MGWGAGGRRSEGDGEQGDNPHLTLSSSVQMFGYTIAGPDVHREQRCQLGEREQSDSHYSMLRHAGFWLRMFSYSGNTDIGTDTNYGISPIMLNFC